MDSLYEFPGKDFPCRACPECKVLRGLKRSRVEIMQPRRVVSERERGREVRSACTASPRRTDGRTERRRGGAAPLFAAQEAKARPTATATAEGNGREDPRMRHGCNGRRTRTRMSRRRRPSAVWRISNARSSCGSHLSSRALI